MAEQTGHKVHPEGRRLSAPPRRLPNPANDNTDPRGGKILRAALLAGLVAAAGTLTAIVGG